MFCELLAIPGFVNSIVQANIIVDSGCLSYTLCDSRFVRQNNLQRIPVTPLGLEGFDGSKNKVATEVAILDLNLDSYSERIFAYIIPLSGHDVFLGLLWIYKRNITLNKNRKSLQLGTDGPTIRSLVTQESELAQLDSPCLISAVAFAQATSKRRKSCRVFAASFADINKALRKLEAQSKAPDLSKLLAEYY